MEQICVSVIMPVYNTKEEYLREAIESILNQTFSDFEFIMIDDHSDKETVAVINSYKDKRIKILTNEQNMGVTVSLNRGLSVASGKYIARMDSDDNSYPDRIRKQFEYLEEHDDVDILGTYVIDGNKVRYEFAKVSQAERQALFMLENVGPIHPSVMIRRSFLDMYGLKYNEEIRVAQDYDLWVRSNEHTNICFYPETLLKRRKHEGRVGSKNRSEQHGISVSIRAKLMLPLIEDSYDKDNIESILLSSDRSKLEELLKKLKRANDTKKLYDKNTVNYVISAYRIMYVRNNYHGLKRRFHQIPLIVFGDIFRYRSYRSLKGAVGIQG